MFFYLVLSSIYTIFAVCIPFGVKSKDFIMNIDEHINNILNGTEDLPKFNQPEHAGVCSAGPLLVGAILVCDIARKSIESGGYAGKGETTPANWEIDEAQEKAIQVWAEHNESGSGP